MRLFHVSEEEDIQVFKPRIPTRVELDQSKGLVWAITEACLPNFLTPRNCPRVAYYLVESTSIEDRKRFFSSSCTKHVVAIESTWFERMKATSLYLYEFNPTDFYLQDEVAGFFVSETAQVPIGKHLVTDLFGELFNRQVEVRLVQDLKAFGDEVKQSSLNWSLCRMGNL